MLALSLHVKDKERESTYSLEAMNLGWSLLLSQK
jgi:hypothetical protein